MSSELINRAQPMDDRATFAGSASWLIVSLFFIVGTVFSLWLLHAYEAGDALSYTRFYEALFDLPPQHWPYFQRAYLGSAEPLYRYAVGLGAYFGVDRVAYLSVWNGLFVGSIGYILVKYRCSAIFCVFVLTNYYLLVLLGSAERLKFSYLALVLAFAIENRKLKFALAASSPFFHTQAMVQFASGIGYYVAANIRSFASTPLKTMGIFAVTLLAIGAISYLFFGAVGQSVEEKSAYYVEQSSGIAEAIQWGMLLAAGLIVFKDRFAYFVGMLPMGVLTALFGNRVNVATFALFAALAILQRKTSNPIVLAVMAYMSFKSIAFISDVIQFGDGFAGG